MDPPPFLQSYVHAFQVPAFIPFPEILSVSQWIYSSQAWVWTAGHTYASLLGPLLNSGKKTGLKEFSSHNWYKILQDLVKSTEI